MAAGTPWKVRILYEVRDRRSGRGRMAAGNKMADTKARVGVFYRRAG
jgi:hypothetical protein